MVLDDNEDLSSFVVDAIAMICKDPYKVFTASSLRDLKQQLEDGLHLDAVLLDYELPDGLSTSIVPMLRSRFPEALLALWTGRTSTHGISREGLDHVLVKTESPTEAIDLVAGTRR